MVFNYGFYFILYKFPKTFKIIIFIQLLLTFITGYFSSKYKVNIDDAFFINIIKEIGHAKEVIDFIDILIISGFILVVLYGIIKFSIKQEKISIKDFFNLTYLASKIKNYALFLSIIISIFLSFTVSFQSKYWYVFYEYKTLNREIKKEIFHGIFYYRYFYIIKDIVRYYKSSSSNEEILSTVQEGDVYLDKKFNNITTIFLMSDSVRAESMSLFGFKLNTNPNLQKLYGNKKIYLFKQNVCSTGTFRSLNCMLSLKTAENFRNIKASDYAKERITKYFNYLKIDTYYLANNQVDNITMAYKYIVDKNRYLDSDLFDEDAVLIERFCWIYMNL